MYLLEKGNIRLALGIELRFNQILSVLQNTNVVGSDVLLDRNIEIDTIIKVVQIVALHVSNQQQEDT